MDIVTLAIPEVKILRPSKHGDHRGFFAETYNKRVLRDAGIDLDFVQDNHSFSAAAGTLRGLHFQISPFAQDKLVRVLRGRIMDVAVDVRPGSPSYGRHVSAELSAAGFEQIFVPRGFAHGILTLEPDTEILYKVSAYYAPKFDQGLAWDDPALGIVWPMTKEKIVLSERDRRQPLLKDLPEHHFRLEPAKV